MRPSTRILIGGICILAGVLYPLIPGMQKNASMQLIMAFVITLGFLLLYFGCLRAARQAEKAYITRRRASSSASQNDETSTADAG